LKEPTVSDTTIVDSNKLDDYDYHYDDVPASEKSGADSPLYKYPWRNLIPRILYFSSGTDLQLIQNCPHSDKVKMQCIGGTVLATAVLAFLSGSFAFYTVFGPKPVLLSSEGASVPIAWSMVLMSMFFGLIWSCIIFNLDRFIVSSTGHGDGTEKITWTEAGRALPRIVMAIAIGFVISKPLEIKIMDSEITSKLIDTQGKLLNARKEDEDKKFDKRKQVFLDAKQEKQNQWDMLDKEIKTAEDLRNKARKDLKEELEGLSGSGKAGRGQAANEKTKDLASFTSEYESKLKRNEPEKEKLKLDISELDGNINKLDKERDEKEKDIRAKVATENGLMARLRVIEENDSYRHAGYFLMFLMIMLEISPIIFKMMITLSPYDYIQENIKLKSIARRGIVLNDKGTEVSLSDSEYYEAELIKAEQKGKSDIEIELLQEAHKIFKDNMKEEMRKDPHRFIDLVRMETDDK